MNNLTSRFFSFLLFLCVLLVGIANCGELKLTPVIPTTYGPIQGSVGVYKEVKVFQYKGVPYAKPPLGPLRFRRPSPPDRWTETLKVTEYGKSCIQNQQGGSAVAPEDSDENCLFLNVFTTQAAYQEREIKKRSVLFWIHGGAFLGGSSTERDAFNPIPLVPLHDVILVTINYRLNVFGFLLPGEAVPEIHGNMGMWDQNFALRWVHDNIGQFGGDPRQVTIFGESAGSISVGLHLISPMSKHLFKRAIMESGAPWPVAPNARQSVINSSLNVIDKVGCSGKENPLKCLQEMDASEFLLTKFPPLHLEMKPIFGDEFLPKTPEEAFKDKSFNKGKNLLVGSEQNDGSLFLGIFNASFIDPKVQLSYSDGVKGLKAITGGKNLDFFVKNYLGSSKDISTKRIRSALIKALGDILFTCPTYAFGHSLANLSQSENQVFGYMHTQKPKKSMIGICNIDRSLGPCHTDEIPYVFGEPFRKPKEFTKADFLLSMNMMKIWIDFARTGEPPQQGPVQWPKFSHKDGKTHIMELNDRFIGKLITNRPSFCIDYWHIFSSIPML